MKERRARRAHKREGLVIVDSIDRGQLIIEDPEKYFEEARARARAQVERDMERERRLSRA